MARAENAPVPVMSSGSTVAGTTGSTSRAVRRGAGVAKERSLAGPWGASFDGTGAKGLTLTTQLTNVTAQRLYEACGWTRDDEFFHYSRFLSVPADRLK